MLRWTTITMLALATAAAAADLERPSTSPSLFLYAADPGRTDGPEGSEYGKGGYGRFRSEGQLYVEGYLGSATVSTEYESGLETQEADLFTGRLCADCQPRRPPDLGGDALRFRCQPLCILLGHRR